MSPKYSDKGRRSADFAQTASDEEILRRFDVQEDDVAAMLQEARAQRE
jgi:hypothetical protein